MGVGLSRGLCSCGSNAIGGPGQGWQSATGLGGYGEHTGRFCVIDLCSIVPMLPTRETAEGLAASASSPVLGAQPADHPVASTSRKGICALSATQGGPWVNRKFDPLHTVGQHVVASLANRWLPAVNDASQKSAELVNRCPFGSGVCDDLQV